jgi:NADH:ubiquinone oxidoreductase subunit 3 (subunit A)
VTPFRKLVALLTLFGVAVLMFLLLAASAGAGSIGAVELLVWFVLLLAAEIGVMYALGRAFARRDRRRAAARGNED